MTDNFRSASCSTRHGSDVCDCDYVKPLTKEQKEIARLRMALRETQSALCSAAYSLPEGSIRVNSFLVADRANAALDQKP